MDDLLLRADSVVEWLRTSDFFDSSDGSAVDDPQLWHFADGGLFLDIVREACPELADSVTGSGLESVISFLQAYYEDDLEDIALSEGVAASVAAAAASPPDDEQPSEEALALMLRIAQLVLGCCVQSDRKEEYVTSIMGLESTSAKMQLMHMVQEVIEEWGADPPGAGDDEGDEADDVDVEGAAEGEKEGEEGSGESRGEAMASPSASTTPLSRLKSSTRRRAGRSSSKPATPLTDFVSRSLDASPKELERIAADVAAEIDASAPSPAGGATRSSKRLARQNELLAEENTKLQEEVSRLESRIKRLKAGNDTDSEDDEGGADGAGVGTRRSTRLRKGQKANLRGEVDAILEQQAREEALQTDLSDARDRVAALEKDLARQTKLAAEAARLRDELDILRPVVAEKAKAEASLERCKNRLEALSEVAEQMRRAEAENERLLSNQLGLEEQAALLPGLRKQLEEYKEDLTASQVRVSELEAAVDEKHAEAQALLARCGDLAAEQADGDYSAAMLKAGLEQLAASSASGGAATGVTDSEADATGVGQGVSEFNPAIAEKLARLQKENAALRAGLSRESSSNVETLEKTLDDSRRLKGVFEQKYHTAAKRITELEGSLAAARATITQQEGALEAAAEEASTLSGRLEEMTAQYEASHARANGLDAELKAKSEEWAGAKADFEARLLAANEAAEAEAERVTAEARATEEAHAGAVAQLHADAEAAARAAAEALAAEQESATAALDKEHQAHEELKQVHVREIASWEQKLADAEAAAADADADATQRLEALTAELAAFREAHSVTDAEHAEQVASLEAALQEFKEQHSVSDAEHKDVVADMEAKLAQVGVEKAAVQRVLDDAKAENNSLTARVEALTKSANSMKGKLGQAAQRNKLLSKQCEFLQREESKLRKAAEMRGTQESEVSVELKRITSEHKKLLETSRRQKSTIDALERSVKRLRERRASDASGGSSNAAADAAADVSPASVGAPGSGGSGRYATRGSAAVTRGARRVTRASRVPASTSAAAAMAPGSSDVDADSEGYVVALKQLHHEIDTLKKENSTMMVMQAEETSKRHSVETSNMELTSENERLKAENVSLKLKVLRREELAGTNIGDFAATVAKENAGGASCVVGGGNAGVSKAKNGATTSTQQRGRTVLGDAAANTARVGAKVAVAALSPQPEKLLSRSGVGARSAVIAEADDEFGDDEFAPASSVSFGDPLAARGGDAFSRRATLAVGASGGTTVTGHTGARRTSMYAMPRSKAGASGTAAALKAAEARSAAAGEKAPECKSQ